VNILATKEAKLNLVISARDEAKAVFESFVIGLKTTTDEIKTLMSEAFSSSELEGFKETVGQVKQSLENIANPSEFESLNKSIKDVRESLSTMANPSELTSFETGVSDLRSAIESLANDTQSQTRTIESSFERMALMVDNNLFTIGERMQSMDENVKVMAENFSSASNTITESTSGIKDALDFGNLQIAGQMIEGVGQKITGFYENATSSAADFDQEIVNTAASLNSNLPEGIRLSTHAIKEMQNEALKLSQTGFFSANQISEAMNIMAKQGIDYTHIMKGGIQTVSAVAAANQEDLGQTANVVSDIMHEMGDELQKEFGGNLQKQLTGVGDAMTSTMHHARLSMEDYLTTMKYVGPQASEMGLGVKDLSTAIALLGEHGIKGSQAGTGLRRMLTNLTPTTKKATEAFAELGFTTKNGGNIFYDATGHMKPLVEVQKLLYEHTKNLTPQMKELAMKTIFGQNALSQMTAIAETTPAAFEELHKSMSKVGVTADLVKEKSQGWDMHIQQLQAHFAAFMKEIGENLKGVMFPLYDLLNSLMSAFESLSGPVKEAITIFGAITGVVLTLGGAFVAFVGTLGIFMTAWEAGLAALSAIAAPAAVVVGAIAAVVAVIALLVTAWRTNFGGLRDFTTEIWNSIKGDFSKAIDAITAFVSNGVKEITKWWRSIEPDFAKAVHNIIALIEWLKPIWTANWNVIKSIFQGVWVAIKASVSGALEAIEGVIGLFIHFFSGNWKKMGEDITKITHGLLTEMTAIFKGIYTIISGIVKSLATEAYQWGVNMIDMLIKGIESMIGKVESTVSNVANSVKKFLGFHSPTEEGPASDSDKWMPNMVNMFADGIQSHAPKIQDAVANVAVGLKTSFSETHNVVQSISAQPVGVPASAQRGGVNINNLTIQVDGTSKKNANEIAELIAQKFRTQMAMVSG
jgi:TP901 family phage tail tape measure protein